MVELGSWTFNEIKIEDIDIFSEYIKVTEYPVNLWSSNFTYIWSCSQSKLRKVLWKIIDEMLVIFGHSYKNTLYLFCLPLGKGDPEKIIDVLNKCLRYCYEWNNQEKERTLVRIVNDSQVEFLKNSPRFDALFRLVTLQGIERHYSIEKLISLKGSEFNRIRNRVNKFHRENPNAITRRYITTDYEKVIQLGNHWKDTAGKKYSRIFDVVYYKEMINHCDEFEQIILVIEKDGSIIGVVTAQILPAGQAWGGLLKYQEGIPGISETLYVEIAKELNKINSNIELLNTGSDLGPGGLREYKLKFKPVLNLKRYQLYLR